MNNEGRVPSLFVGLLTPKPSPFKGGGRGGYVLLEATIFMIFVKTLKKKDGCDTNGYPGKNNSCGR